MTIDWQQIDEAPRLLMQAELKPIQGTRFQPTGFPDLGAAAYDAPGKGRVVLVESAQSMANRLEAVCWDEASASTHAALEGMPYVAVALPGKRQAVSIKEAHRLNSPYFITAQDEDGVTLHQRVLEGSGYEAGHEVDIRKLAKAVLYVDPNAVLHGVFFSNVRDGRLRMKRLVSAFIEASEVELAESGMVKNSTFDPTGQVERAWIKDLDNSDIKAMGYEKPGDYRNRLNETVQNIIGHKTEYTAERITAYFNLDLAQIRAYGLGESVERFLVTLALWKVRRFLETGLRLRTACDLDMDGGLKVTRPEGFVVPPTPELEADLPGLIKACAGLFANPPVTELTFNKGK